MMSHIRETTILNIYPLPFPWQRKKDHTGGGKRMGKAVKQAEKIRQWIYCTLFP
jgi:hypothetical protein